MGTYKTDGDDNGNVKAAKFLKLSRNCDLPSGFAKGKPQSGVNEAIRQRSSTIFEAIFLSSVTLHCTFVRLLGLMMYS